MKTLLITVILCLATVYGISNVAERFTNLAHHRAEIIQ